MTYDPKAFKKSKHMIFYPFGHKGKKYENQKTEIIVCPECKENFEAQIMLSSDPEFMGFCHVANPDRCPHCNQKFWYRDGFEK